MVNRFNVVRAKKYTDNQGQEKTAWLQVGAMTEFTKDDGSVNRILEMNDSPVIFQIFPFKEAQSQPKQEQQEQGEDIRVENIPF